MQNSHRQTQAQNLLVVGSVLMAILLLKVQYVGTVEFIAYSKQKG